MVFHVRRSVATSRVEYTFLVASLHLFAELIVVLQQHLRNNIHKYFILVSLASWLCSEATVPFSCSFSNLSSSSCSLNASSSVLGALISPKL